MSDRLKDLQRQRALAQEQAAALEREIRPGNGSRRSALRHRAGPIRIRLGG
ncbi:MAG: hypothetical protein WDM96_04435 [Lacunisphaera sp.]